MSDNDSKGISYTAGFFMLIAFVIAGIMLSGQLMVPVWTSMTGKSATTLRDGLIESSDSNALKVIQALTAIVGFLIPTLITAAMLNRRPLKLIGFSIKGIQLKQALLVLLIIAAALFTATALSYFTELIPLSGKLKEFFDKLEEDYTRQVSAIVSLRTPLDFILALIIMALLPAVCEEALFRGGMQNFLARGTHRPWVAILVVSLLFSLAHLSFYGFLSRFFLGIVLGLIYQYSGKLWLSILGHFANNALAITTLYVYLQQGKPIKDAMRETQGSIWGLVGIPVVIILFVAFKRQSNNRTDY